MNEYWQPYVSPETTTSGWRNEDDDRVVGVDFASMYPDICVIRPEQFGEILNTKGFVNERVTNWKQKIEG